MTTPASLGPPHARNPFLMVSPSLTFTRSFFPTPKSSEILPHLHQVPLAPGHFPTVS